MCQVFFVPYIHGASYGLVCSESVFRVALYSIDDAMVQDIFLGPTVHKLISETAEKFPFDLWRILNASLFSGCDV